MKWSAPLETGSIGTRRTSLQVTPSDEALKTMSFDAQFLRKRQSSHATYTFPAPSISALGSGDVRSDPATSAKREAEIVTALDHVPPPSVDRNAASLPFRLSNGTTTVPFGCTSGWPPRPLSLPAVATGVLHVRPPSVDVLMYSRSPCAKLSNSV